MSLSGVVLRFHPDEEILPSWYHDLQGPPNFPCFVSKGTHTSPSGREYDAEAYQFYFRQNPAIGLFGLFRRSRPLGYHEHDVEALIVLYDKGTTTPQHVYFKAHGRGQGVWRTWEECEKTEDGRLVAYVALNSHAMYPFNETVVRIFGFANDRLSSRGRTLRYSSANYVEAPLVEFGGGIEITNTIPDIPNRSITEVERIALPLVQDTVRNAREVEA